MGLFAQRAFRTVDDTASAIAMEVERRELRLGSNRPCRASVFDLLAH
jgi:hypothetical protein